MDFKREPTVTSVTVHSAMYDKWYYYQHDHSCVFSLAMKNEPDVFVNPLCVWLPYGRRQLAESQADSRRGSCVNVYSLNCSTAHPPFLCD